MDSSCKFETYEQEMMDRINKALNQESYLVLEDNNWNELYIRFFLSIYLQICDVPSIQFADYSHRAMEPVLLQVNPSNGGSDTSNVLHIVSTSFLRWLFVAPTNKHVEIVDKCSLKIPSVFPLIEQSSTYGINQPKQLNAFVSNKLVMYYVYADHAAYHYRQFAQTGNADYEHKYIRTRSNNITTQNVRHVHDLITSQPNNEISNYLKPHQALQYESNQK